MVSAELQPKDTLKRNETCTKGEASRSECLKNPQNK